MDTWVHQMIRTTCRRRVLAWGLILCGAVLFAAAQHRYVRNFVMGPFEVGQPYLDSVTDVTTAPRYFVKVTGSRALDTGVQQVTIHKRGGVETSRSVSAAYFALVVGDRLLVVKSAAGAPTTAEGELVRMPGDLRRQLFGRPGVAAIESRFYPYFVDDGAFRLPGYIAIGAALVLGFLFWRYGLPAWRYLHAPSSHPLVKRVASWGDPLGIALDAKRESESPRHKGGGWLVTDKYLIQRTVFRFDLLRHADLLWAYKRVTKHSVNFIPTGKSYAAVLACYGGAAEVRGREKKVDAVLAFAAERAPWAVFGFSDDLSKMFKKKPQDFCLAVEERKREWASKGPARPSP